MDGTLLHTLPDLAAVTNKALELEGFPPHTEEQIRTFVGNGALALARLAVPDGATEEQAEKVFRNFKSLYGEFGLSLTSEFEGMTETLKELHARGKKLGIMSNKFEGGVKDVEAKFFPGLFDKFIVLLIKLMIVIIAERLFSCLNRFIFDLLHR